MKNKHLCTFAAAVGLSILIGIAGVCAFVSAMVLCEAVPQLPTVTKTAEAAEPEETPAKTTFTAAEAVLYANENSLDLKAKQENITACELKAKADNALKRRVNNTYNATGTAPGINDIDTFLLTSGYVEYADEVQTVIARRTLSESKYQLKMQVENKFYSCLNADRKVAVAKEALNNANENARIAAEKRNAGLIGEIEANSFALAVISAQNEMDKAEKSRDYMYEELKLLMSYPAESDITLTGSFERQPMNTTDLESALAGIDKNANKLNLDASLDLQARLLEKYKSLYTTSMNDYQAQKYTYAKEEAEYNENVGKLKLGIRNAYNTMTDTYNQLNYIDKAIELKEQQAEAQKTSYELGLSTASEYITAVQELDSLKLQRVDAEIGAYLTSQAYELSFHPAEL